jgi:predicted enzyme related to lactoylglutathione lyase
VSNCRCGFAYTAFPMTNIEKHRPGSFCWIELATTDQAAAKKFYGELFGWATHDMPMGPDAAYTLFQLQGKDAAAGYTLRPDQSAQGVPPHWMIYVTVENADATAKRVAELGGKVVAPAFDVGTLGRMAVIQDPTGVVFSVWQPKEGNGIGIKDVDGTLCWADLSTPYRDRAGKFYSELFGWEMVADKDENSGYLHIKNGEDFIGGMLPPEHLNPNAPPHWLAYFQVSDCEASAAKAKQLGAALYLEPMFLENVGTMSVVADPQRAVFAIFQTARKS